MNGRLADPASDFSKVEKEAIAKGNLVQLEFVMNDPNIAGSGTQAGDKPGDSIVSIDLGETVKIDNLTDGKVTSSRVERINEAAEHEVAGHALDAIRDHGRSRSRSAADETHAIDAENRYRDRAGIPFHRNYPPNYIAVLCDSRGQCPK